MEGSRPPARGPLAAIDRWFPVLGFLLLLYLPAATFSDASFAGWHDQKLYLEALRSVLDSGRAELIDGDIIGPAYIALAALLHWVSGVSPESSLVTLSKVSYAGAVAVSLVLVRTLVMRAVAVPPSVAIAAQGFLLALVYSSWTWRWAEFPWTHFVATFAGLSFYALRFSTKRVSPLAAASIGVALSGLALIRTFEFVSLILAWALGSVVLALLGARPRLPHRANVLAGAATALTTIALVYGITGKRDAFVLYGSNLDRQAAAVDAAEVAETPTFSFGLVPTKLVQLFVDPCFLSICRLDDYEPGPRDVLEVWRMPLAVQLPALLLLPLCVVGVALLAVRSRRRGRLGPSAVRELRPLVEMTIAASGLALGYTASTLAGPGHLKFGFFREFLLASMLSGVVAIGLLSTALWTALGRRGQVGLVLVRKQISPQAALVIGAVLGIVALFVAMSVARSHGLPRIESRHLAEVGYVATCEGGRCQISMLARDERGNRVEIPDASTLTFGCGSERARFTLYARHPEDGVELPSSCRDPRLTAAWPIVMGLPADSSHLRAVDVSTTTVAG